ncbi:MAG: hypothetical protein HYR56_17955 [Acidobacteria bacterium]|nr:hypothetical protein [Acidobacteriota bacterium]MBI3424100.1 hypothetical protein [Acidobacteriota bacterium]
MASVAKPTIASPASASTPARHQMTVTPSLRATLVEGLSQMFAFERGGSVKAVCLFAVSVATASWIVDSLLPVIQEASQYLIGWSSGPVPAHHFTEPLVKLVLPLLAFGTTVAFLIFNALRNARPFVVASVVPDPHPGFILQLSVYQPRGPTGQSRYATVAELQTAVNDGALDLAELFKSNWGQMAFAVRYHAPVLRHCWIICRLGAQGSSQYFETATGVVQTIVKSISGRAAVCYKVEIDDENDIGQTAQSVAEIYRRLPETAPDLRPHEIIADFTGGTTAMSGRMILATLHKEREIEYIRRGVTLTPELDAAGVREQRIVISPQRLRAMVEMFERK